MADEPRIRDIPSIQKILKDAKLVMTASKVISFLDPLLRRLGFDFSEPQKLIDAHGGDVGKVAERLAALPDRFNDLFAERGWIAHGLIDLDVAERAIALGENGDFDGADEILADSCTVDWVRLVLIRLSFSKAFGSRSRIAQLALLDYAAARYHASVPVVLALLDGYVNDVGDRGFHAENADLSAWDSIVGHIKGLKHLHEVVNKTGRQKLRTERITIPYRNGILHGMDVGYDNKIVAAKTWAALAAIAEWGMTVERGEKLGRPPKQEKTFRELLKQLSDNARLRRRLEEWKPRDIVVGRDVAPSGEESQYPERTPERALVRMLTSWRSRNYGAMTEFVWRSQRESRRGLAGEVRQAFDDVRLKEFELREIRDAAGAATHVVVRCKGEVVDREPFDCEIEIRLFLEGDDGLAMMGDAGTWTIPMLFDVPRRIISTLPLLFEEVE